VSTTTLLMRRGQNLLWPRHSWRAAKNSSIDSSSGQKSPCKIRTSSNRILLLLGDQLVEHRAGIEAIARIIDFTVHGSLHSLKYNNRKVGLFGTS
jgi:hypothetical protein